MRAKTPNDLVTKSRRVNFSREITKCSSEFQLDSAHWTKIYDILRKIFLNSREKKIIIVILCFKICFRFFQVHHRPGGRHSIRFVAFWIRHRWDDHTHWIAQDCQIAQIGPRCQKNWQILRVRSGRAYSTYGHIRPYCSLVGLYLVRFSYKKYVN